MPISFQPVWNVVHGPSITLCDPILKPFESRRSLSPRDSKQRKAKLFAEFLNGLPHAYRDCIAAAKIMSCLRPCCDEANRFRLARNCDQRFCIGTLQPFDTRIATIPSKKGYGESEQRATRSAIGELNNEPHTLLDTYFLGGKRSTSVPSFGYTTNQESEQQPRDHAGTQKTAGLVRPACAECQFEICKNCIVRRTGQHLFQSH